jgi:hypothetical protein
MAEAASTGASIAGLALGMIGVATWSKMMKE